MEIGIIIKDLLAGPRGADDDDVKWLAPCEIKAA